MESPEQNEPIPNFFLRTTQIVSRAAEAEQTLVETSLLQGPWFPQSESMSISEKRHERRLIAVLCVVYRNEEADGLRRLCRCPGEMRPSRNKDDVSKKHAQNKTRIRGEGPRRVACVGEC